MGLFTRKKKDERTRSAPATAGATIARTADRDLHGVLLRPRVTEKAVGMTDRGVYTFVIRQGATKYDVRDAIKAIYKVTPARVHIVSRAPAKRQSGSRGRIEHVPGLKKAYVYLKKGDSITLV
jgi:large subunit ribosomal protein L23